MESKDVGVFVFKCSNCEVYCSHSIIRHFNEGGETLSVCHVCGKIFLGEFTSSGMVNTKDYVGVAPRKRRFVNG